MEIEGRVIARGGNIYVDCDLDEIVVANNLVTRIWVYCNMPVSGTFVSCKMYMLIDADGLTLSSGDARYLKANGALSYDFSDMKPLSSTKSMVANMPALNDYVTYKVVAMSPYIGEVKGIVASLTSIPYVVETYLAANGTETGTNDNAAKAGNMNAARTGDIALTVTGGSDLDIYLYLSLSKATLGAGMEAWNFIDGVEGAVTLGTDTNTANNPLAENRQRLVLDMIDAVNVVIIKGNDGNYLYLIVSVDVT